MWFSMCLLAVLGSQGIVVKCTAAMFFRTVDCTSDLAENVMLVSVEMKAF